MGQGEGTLRGQDMKFLIQLFNILFSRPPTLWQILLMIGFAFWAIGALMPILGLLELQEVMALLGFISLLGSLWFLLRPYPLSYLGIDLKSILVWLCFCLIISRNLDGLAKKVLWIASPEAIALTQVLPDALRLRSLELKSREARQLLQRNTLILLSSLLISCWIYFYYMINRWVTDYSWLTDLDEEQMKNSLFVIPLNLDKIPWLFD